MLNETIEHWITSSELPQNINIHGANIAVKFIVVVVLFVCFFVCLFFKRKGNTCL